ncbi:MAG: hypothetical protein KDA81_15015 [Planctomycetaceae bacterium]|nr:hypothetical protein [Planctomycetaceae bacterium]
MEIDNPVPQDSSASGPAVPWRRSPEVSVDLNIPVARRFHHLPDEIVALGSRLLEAVMKDIPQKARSFASLIRIRTANRFHAEFAALSQRVGADWQSLALANVSYDLVISIFGCSTVALPTPSGPIIARNMDWWPEDVLAQCSCLVRYFRGGRLAFANAGWPGAVGVVTGLSAAGFAVVLNAVSCSEGICRTGYPVLLHLRRVLEDATDFDDAFRMLTRRKLFAPALITLVGRTNEQRVVIERSPTRCALRWANDNEALITTNDYRVLERPSTNDTAEIYRTTCSRFDYLTQFFREHDSSRAVAQEKLLYALTDSAVIQSITAQHIVMHPASDTIELFVPERLLSGT